MNIYLIFSFTTIAMLWKSWFQILCNYLKCQRFSCFSPWFLFCILWFPDLYFAHDSP